MYCLLNWDTEVNFINVILDEDGNPEVFDTIAEAKKYAEEWLNFEWRVVKLQNEGGK